jgi:hypothetical protein
MALSARIPVLAWGWSDPVRAPDGQEAGGREPGPAALFLRLPLLAGLPLALLALLVPGALTDPFLEADAYAALADDAALFARTAENGRWLAWLWSRLGALSPGEAALLAHGLRALAAGLVALAVFRSDARPWRALVAATALLLAPQAAAASSGLPETTPAAALLATYAALALLLSPAWARGALYLAVPAGLMTHPAVPLALLAILLAAGREEADGAALLRALRTFAIAAGLGAGAILGLNLAVHGILGFAGAEAGAPAADGLDRVEEWLGAVLSRGLGPAAPIALAALAAALAVLFRASPRRADMLFGGLVCALLMPALGLVVTGEASDFAATLFVAVFAVAILGRAARAARHPAVSGAMLGALGYLALAGAADWHALHAAARPYQEASRALAAEMRAGPRAEDADAPAQVDRRPPPRTAGLAPPIGRVSAAAHPPPLPPARYVLGGSPAALPGVEVLRRFDALAARLSHLLRAEVVQCPSRHAACDRHGGRIARMPQRPAPGWIARAADGSMLVRLPDGVFRPARR